MPNRLATQTSPYLLQHAGNPVEWWPWGPEAFAEARRRDVPILLSIGYSTCYWCHVMERESFENPSVAAVINRETLPIKLDREERPDVDDLYMAAALIVRGQGGWPLNCFLEPGTLKPFFCGTYFPAEPRGGLPGFAELVARVGEAWRTRRADLLRDADTIADAVREQAATHPDPVDLTPAVVADAVETLLRLVDRTHGGFGAAPKFPQPTLLELLLDVRPRAGDVETRDAIDSALRRTLDAMLIGGIHDHLGGGFHRYAVDQTWTVPHFEKMLYDNAQLAAVYAHAARLYGDPEYARAARRTIEYVLRELTDPTGAFLSAQDAEVDHREGLNYLWTPEQFREVLPAEDAAWAIRVYGLDSTPNFRDPHHPDDPPAFVLRLRARPEVLAGEERLTRDEFLRRLDAVNARLFAARAARKHPLTDDKIIASWNGLMIAACARAGRLLHEPRFLDAARRAADRVLELFLSPTGLKRVARGGAVGPAEGLLEDYACLAAGLVELARLGPEHARYLDHAADLARRALRLFREGDCWYDTPADAPDLFVRSSSIHDGAAPSAVSVMFHVLIDLAELTGDDALARAAIAGTRAHSGRIASSPAGAVNSVRALFRLLISRPEARGVLAPGGPAPGAAVRTTPHAGERGGGVVPVEVYADVDRVVVTPDTPGVLRLNVKIAPGYHLIAADPGPVGSALVPFRVGVAGGSGVEVYADYPPGERLGGDPQGPLCYREGFEMTVAVERAGEWKGRPMLTVTCQACSESECLSPMAVELAVALDPG
jgi:uncharacterized protein YyaL (SSP411 family)